MGKKYNKTIGVRTGVDILFVLLFLGLTAIGKIQVWFALFAVGALVSAFAGRFYCGWLCPMHTLMRPIDFLYNKFLRRGRQFWSGNSGRLAPPAFLTGNGARYGFLLLFLGAAVSQGVLGLQAPVLPILTSIALVLILFFQEQWWHSVLCPFGTILTASSGKAKFGMLIDEDTCTGCGLCEKTCPADAIYPASEEQTAVRRIESSRCLTCFACARACSLDAIGYGAAALHKGQLSFSAFFLGSSLNNPFLIDLLADPQTLLKVLLRSP